MPEQFCDIASDLFFPTHLQIRPIISFVCHIKSLFNIISLHNLRTYVVWLVEALHYSGKVEGSIPDEVTGFLNLPNLSCTMALGSVQPVTEISTKNLHGGKGRPDGA
jgi:hypothetical protein